MKHNAAHRSATLHNIEAPNSIPFSSFAPVCEETGAWYMLRHWACGLVYESEIC